MNWVLVTGGAGFVGASVVRKLIDEGSEVALLMRKSSNSRRISDLLDKCTVIHCDLAQIESVQDSLKDFSPDGVVHLAWEGVKGVDRNSADQMNNVVASINLFRMSEKIGCDRFVGLGSQAEYGPVSGRICETVSTHPTTVYGAAKLSTGLILERVAAASGRSFAWLRLFSSYGPDDDPSWLISYLIRSLLAGEEPSLTKAEQVWDYIHVNDVAAAIVAALDTGVSGFFNLGSGQDRPLREIILMIRDMIDPKLPLGFGKVPYRPDQVMHLAADITALSLASGWTPSISLESGIAETIAWHQREKLNAK